MAVGNLLDIAASAATLREMEVTQRRRILMDDIHVLMLSPLNAKDREPISLGRFPGFWLQALLISPSHPAEDGGCPSELEEMSCSPVTVARLHRICTDFPITPRPRVKATQ